MSQSPIFLTADTALMLKDPLSLMTIDYPDKAFPGHFEVHHDHANFVFDPPGAKSLAPFPGVTFRDAKYRLAKIHVHSESEHVVEKDDPCDCEIHLIHVPDGSPVGSPLVVIGILYSLHSPSERSKKTQRKTSPFAFLKECPGSSESLKSAKTVKINPLNFFPILSGGKPDTVNWFHYEGSLTGFPFSEIVSWFVMKSAGDVTQAEVNELQKCAKQPPRGLQPLDRRLVVCSFS